jgi:hypothetical protein
LVTVTFTVAVSVVEISSGVITRPLTAKDAAGGVVAWVVVGTGFVVVVVTGVVVVATGGVVVVTGVVVVITGAVVVTTGGVVVVVTTGVTAGTP